MTYDYPIWYIFLSLLISVLLSFFMYKKNIKTSWKFVFMAFLRFLSLLIIFITIGGLLLQSEIQSKIKPKLILAFDQSSSMLANASFEELNSIYTKINSSQISSNYRVKNIGFGEKVSEIDSLKFKAVRTNIDDLESRLKLLLSDDDRVVLVTDGNINSGRTTVFNTKNDFSVDVVAVGDTVWLPKLDISKIHYNKKVVVGNSFPLELFFNTLNFSGNLTLQISEKDKIVYSDKISVLPNSNQEQKYRHVFILKSKKVGKHIYKIKLFSDSDSSLRDEKNVAIDFVKNRGLIIIKYRKPSPDISLFKRSFVARNYKVVVTKNKLNKNEFRKCDFVVDFDNDVEGRINIPLVKIGEFRESSARTLTSGLDKKYLKDFAVDSRSKKVFIDIDNLWKLNFKEVQRGEKNIDNFFDVLLREIELLEYSDKFNVIFKDEYSSSENALIRLVNASSQINSIDAKAEIEINNKKQKLDFIEDNGEYKLNLGTLDKGIYSSKIVINDKILKTISFSVKDIDLEKMTSGQNTKLLKSIALTQGGNYYYLHQIDGLVDKLSLSTKFKIFTKTEKKNLVQQWWYLFLLPLILGTEWLLRKRNGLY